MGQKPGKASYADAAQPFVNLSRGGIEALWEAFNDVADGFGINVKEAREIFAELQTELEVSRVKVDERSQALFELLDTDENGLVDALELLTALAAASGMSTSDALSFTFCCYDFDGSARLTLDEAALALRGALVGLCKMAEESCPPEAELEEIVIAAFERHAGGAAGRIKVPNLVEFCLEHPEVRSWLEYFTDTQDTTQDDDADKSAITPLEVLEQDIDFRGEMACTGRSGRDAAASEAVLPMDTAKRAAARAALLQQPWIRATEALAPSASVGGDTAAIAAATAPPDATVRLQWVHGYAGERCRNNVRYGADGRVVYFAGRLGISYEPRRREQVYCFEHTDDVSCLAMHPEGTVVATGEVGAEPKVVVWHAATATTIVVLRGVHRRAVTHLAFSLGGRLLASVGGDEYHTLAVHDWRAASLLFSAPTTSNLVLGLCFSQNDQVVTCGHNHIYFWREEGRLRRRRRGAWGRKAAVQPLVVCSPLRGLVVAGAASGLLLAWEGRNCIRAIRAHNGSLNALCEGPLGLVSGGKDMRVRLWTFKLEPGAVFDLSAFGPLPSIRSVCMSRDGTRILLGTKACEIYEISAADGSDMNGGAITAAHYGGPLRGLAAHPLCAEFATAGADGAVRTWDATRRLPVRSTKLPWPANCIDYSPDGLFLVVGVGMASADSSDGVSGSNGASVSSGSADGGSGGGGGFVVLNASDLSRVFEARDSTQPIVEARWGPNKETVALGGRDCGVYIYTVGDGFELVATGRQHSQAVRGIDFSADGRWVRSDCPDGEAVFWDADKGRHQPDLAKFKEIGWATETCVAAWPAAGAWPDDGAALTAVDRSPDGRFLLAGDDFGRLRLHRYPCPPPALGRSAFLELRAHAKDVSRVRHLREGNVVVSLGAEDRCVLQWELVVNPEAGGAGGDEAGAAAAAAAAVVAETTAGATVQVATPAHEGLQNGGAISATNEADLPASPAPEPWLQMSAAPTRPPLLSLEPPVDGLELERVRGYRGDAAYACGSTRAVFAGGGVGVSADLITGRQAFQLAHPGGVSRLAVSGDGRFVATADANSPWPAILVWEAATAATMAKICAAHEGAVTALGLSEDGSIIAAAGANSEHSLTLHAWRATQGALLRGRQCRGSAAATALAVNAAGTRIIDCSEQGVVFWEAPNSAERNGSGSSTKIHVNGLPELGRNLTRAAARLGVRGRRQPAMCCAFAGSVAVAGMADGHVYIFVENSTQLRRTVKAHTGPVRAVCAGLGGLIATGGVDGMIAVLGEDYSIACDFAVADIDATGTAAAAATGSESGPANGKENGTRTTQKRGKRPPPAVSAISVSADGSKLLVGTVAGDLLEVSARTGKLLGEVAASGAAAGDGSGSGAGGGVVTAGHAGGGGSGVWGLAYHPTTEMYVTCGDDGAVRAWDPQLSRPVHTVRLDTPARALAFSPDGRLLAVGCGGGSSGRNVAAAGTLLVFEVSGSSGSKGGSTTRRKSAAGMAAAPSGNSGGKSGGGGGGGSSWSVVHEAQPAAEWITDVRFSPDGSRLAVASRDRRIYVHSSASAAEGFPLVATVAAHRCGVTAIDFSSDSRCLQSCDEAAVLAFSDAATGVVIPSADAVRDLDWASHTLQLGWALKGLRNGGGGSSSQSQRSAADLACVSRSKDEALLAFGGTDGKMRLARYPAAAEGQLALRFVGHAGSVRRAAWLKGDDRVVSVGGEDGAVCQWRRTREPDAMDLTLAASASAAAAGEAVAVEEEAALAWPRVAPGRSATTAAATAPGGEDGAAAAGGSWAWNQMVVPPSQPLGALDSSAPQAQLRLEAVHGRRSWDVRGNAAYNREEAVVAAAGTVGVILDTSTGEQRFHRRHAAQITALAVSPCGRYAATGDAADSPAPLVCLWAAGSGACLSDVEMSTADEAINSAESSAATAASWVQCLAFSSDGHWLAVATTAGGRRGPWTVTALHSASGQWRDARRAASLLLGSPSPNFLLFTGHNASFPLMCGCGKRPLVLAMPESAGGGASNAEDGSIACSGSGASLLRKLTVFGAGRASEEQLCGARAGADGVAVTGSVSGYLYKWQQHHLLAAVAGHAAAVYAMAEAGPGALASVGRDGVVRLWSLELDRLRQYSPFMPASAASTLPGGGASGGSKDGAESAGAPAHGGGANGSAAAAAFVGGGGIGGGVRPLLSVCANAAATKLLLATAGGDLIELSRDSGRAALLATGHGADPDGSAANGEAAASSGALSGGGGVWGLDAHPSDADVYATAGDDGFLRIWSAWRRQQLRAAHLDGPARAVAFAPDGLTIAVGSGADGVACERAGAVAVLDAASLEVTHEFRKARGWISDVCYSRDGKLLAVAASDGRIYIHAATDGYALLATTERPDPALSAASAAATSAAVDAAATAAKGADASAVVATFASGTTPAAAAAGGHGALSGVDFSQDAALVRCVSAARQELLVFHVADGRLASRSEARDAKWQLGHCPAAWDMQGAWPPSSSSSAAAADVPVAVDVCRVPRAVPACAGGASAVDAKAAAAAVAAVGCVAVGCADGSLRLFRWPCQVPNASSTVAAAAAHSAAVGRVRWTCDGSRVVSVGGQGRIVVQHRCVLL